MPLFSNTHVSSVCIYHYHDSKEDVHCGTGLVKSNKSRTCSRPTRLLICALYISLIDPHLHTPGRSKQQRATRGLEEPVPSHHSAAERDSAKLSGAQDSQQGEEAPDQLAAHSAGRLEGHAGPGQRPEVAQWEAFAGSRSYGIVWNSKWNNRHLVLLLPEVAVFVSDEAS